MFWPADDLEVRKWSSRVNHNQKIGKKKLLVVHSLCLGGFGSDFLKAWIADFSSANSFHESRLHGLILRLTSLILPSQKFVIHGSFRPRKPFYFFLKSVVSLSKLLFRWFLSTTESFQSAKTWNRNVAPIKPREQLTQ